MKKPTKLNLNELKVESFVTSLKSKDSQTVNGGSSTPCLGFAVGMAIGYGAAIVVSVKIADKITFERPSELKLP